MKKLAVIVLMAKLCLACHTAYCDVPPTAEGWYTPPGGFAATEGEGEIFYGYDKDTGEWQSCPVKVNWLGVPTMDYSSLPESVQRDYRLMTAYQALVKACKNEAVLESHESAIETLGKNLFAVFRENDATSKDAAGNTQQGSISVKPSRDGVTWSMVDLFIPPDNLTIEKNSGGRLALKNWNSIGNGRMLVKNSNGQMAGFGISLGYGIEDFSDDPDTIGWGLENWNNGACEASLGEMLTNPSDSNRGKHLFLAKFSEGNASELHYVPLGDALEIPSFDGVSIASNSLGKIEFNGWKSESHTSSDLADVLSGDANAMQNYELVVRSSGSAAPKFMQIGKLDGLGFAVDDVSVNSNQQGKIQIHNWKTATPDYSKSLAAVLNEASSAPDTSWQVLVRKNGSSAVAYLPIGTIAATAAVQGGGCYTLVNSAAQDAAPVYSFANCYYKVGGVLYSGPNISPQLLSGKFVALRISSTSPGSASIEQYNSFSAMASESANDAYVVSPLYEIGSDGSVVCDFRTIPSAQMIEVL